MDKTKILVVEDEAIVAHDIARQLKDMGYEVVAIVYSGEEAVEQADKLHPDLVLMDIVLAGKMDGIEATDIIRSRGDIPVVFLTAYTDQKRLERAKLVYPFGYVIKPFQSNELKVAVEMALYASKVDGERKKAEGALRESEERYRSLFENASIGIFHSIPEGRFLRVNPALARMLGYGSPAEMIAAITDIKTQIYVESKKHSNNIANTLEQAGWFCAENSYRRKDGAILRANLSARKVLNPDNSLAYLEGLVEDITERKQIEQRLQESEKEARRLAQESALLAEIGKIIGSTLNIEEVFEFFAEKVRELIPFNQITVNTINKEDQNRTIIYDHSDRLSGNRVGTIHPIAGTMTEQVVRKRSSLLIGSKNRENIIKSFPRMLRRSGLNSMIIIPLIANDEVCGVLNMQSAQIDAYNESDLFLAERVGSCIAGAIANVQLYHACKRSEEAIRDSEEKYRSIFENSTEGICQATPEGRFISVNPAMANIYGYESPEEMIVSVTDIGRQFYINPDERARYKALLETDGLIKGFETRSLRKDGTTIWVSLSSRINKDINGNVLYFDTIVEDITKRKQAEENFLKTLESLRKAVSTTIQIMVSTVEARDPYTAGHQVRSADLARAIAVEMGLAQEQIEGIRMAGSIHDIGKISIPAEILSKPTKLSEIEFSLIKEHSRRGFEMLKDVESPWPLAEIVYQHHERMNGSGYPRNLKGEEICIEARILTVADVVEAMASHRPYRACLGIDAALQEIEKNKGIFYDTAVADACLRLFREKDFQLAGA